MTRKVSTPTTRKPRVNKTTTEVVVEKKVSFDLLSQIKIDIKHKNETQKKLTQSIKTGDVTICTGPAGTGKSLISIATALKLLQETDNKYDKLILLKSITQLNGETLPALPGDASEKMMYQNMSFFDSLVKLIGEKITGELVNSNKIKFDVIGSYRGRSISESLIIVDECVHGDSFIDILIDGKEKRTKIKNILFYFDNYDVKVKSFNHETKNVEYKNIQSVRIGKTEEWYKIYVNNRKNPFIITENHPVAIIEDGEIKYQEAKNLKTSDILVRGNIWNDNNHNILLDGYDVLLGFLLGDGSLSKNSQKYKNVYRFSKNHGLKQEEYCKFSADLFNTKTHLRNLSGFTGKNISGFTTKSFLLDKNFISSIYDEKNKKTITDNIIQYFSVRTLATWFMDDGSNNQYSEDGSSITFNTQGFDKNENEILIKILKEKFNIDSTLRFYETEIYNKKGQFKGYYTISVNNENSHILQELIKNYIHPNIEYKLNPKYRGCFNENLYDFKLIEDASSCSIEKIEKVKLEDNELTYNLQIESNENYFIDRILTHNCQNISHDNLKTILTRISDDTKIILLGDPEQIDIRNKKESSLATLVKKVKSNPMEGVNVVEFTEKDIIRHRLTSYFINLFKETPNDIPTKKEIVIDEINKTKVSLFGRVKLFIKSRFQV